MQMPMIVLPGEMYHARFDRWGSWTNTTALGASWRECEIGGAP